GPALTRPDLVAIHQSIPPGPAGANDRFAGLEQRRHAHALPDAKRVPALAIPEQRPDGGAFQGAWQADFDWRYRGADVPGRDRIRPRGAMALGIQDPAGGGCRPGF